MENLKRSIGELLSITKNLKENYPKKHFTLDGRLVGDIGEIYAEKLYRIELFDKIEKFYDGKNEITGEKIQIKATMKKTIGYPRNHNPNILLALKIMEDGRCIEIYNGQTKPITDYIKHANRKGSNYFNFINITVNKLYELNDLVQREDRIPKRRGAEKFFINYERNKRTT